MRVLALIGLLGFLLGAILIVGEMPLVGELVAGLAVAPLMLAIYICLLTSGPSQDGGGDDDGGGGQRTPDPPREPDAGSEWDRFEREFRDYVDQRVPVA
jgi:hypothetical protein